MIAVSIDSRLLIRLAVKINSTAIQ